MKPLSAAIRKAIEHHQKHGDMDGPVCLLTTCALHYPVTNKSSA